MTPPMLFVDAVEDQLWYYHQGFINRADLVKKTISLVTPKSILAIFKMLPGHILAEMYESVERAPKTETEWDHVINVRSWFGAMNEEMADIQAMRERKEIGRFRTGVETLRDYYQMVKPVRQVIAS